MTTATVAAPSGNGYAVWLVIAIVAIFGIAAVLVRQERIVIRQGKRGALHGSKIRDNAEQLATLAGRIQSLADFLEVDINDAMDDSPEALEVWVEAPDHAPYSDAYDWEPVNVDTDEFPVVPCDTEPMAVVNPTAAVQARRDAAWDQTRPSPVPRGKSAEWVEAEIEAMRARNAERMARAAVTEEAS